MQNPSDCSTSRILLYSPHECGLGAELHWLNVAMTAAYVTNRTLVFREDKDWIYAQEPFCPRGRGTFSCYFMPLSSCLVRNEAELRALVGSQPAPLPVLKTQELHAHDSVRVVQYTENLQEQLDFVFSRDVPSSWDARLLSIPDGSHPLFWWRSQLVKQLWRFQPRVAALFDERRANVFRHVPPNTPIIGLHSREGRSHAKKTLCNLFL